MSIVITTHGEIDSSLLEHKTGIDNVTEGEAHWNEYWLGSELVHRSVHLFIKEGLTFNSELASLG